MRKDNFDESVKRILEQQTFAYDPAAWEQAQTLLAKEPNRRLGAWWWTLFFVAISGLVGAGISGLAERQISPANQSVATSSVKQRVENPSYASANQINQKAEASTAANTPLLSSDSTQIPATKTIRLVHNAPETGPTQPDTTLITRAEIDLTTLKQRKAGKLAHIVDELTLSNEFKDLPAFDFKYEDRPKYKPQNDITAFGWAGQQGRNTESSLLQQQYGLGLAWQIELLPNFGIQLGAALGYNNGFAYSSQQNDTSYAFGRTVTSKTAFVKDYLQLQIPFALNYRFGEKHQLELGVANQHYLGSRYRLQTDILTEDGLSSSSSSQLNGKITTVQIPNWSWLLGYRYRLNEAFDLGLRYQQQGNPGIQFPAEKSFRIVLHYHLYQFAL